MYEYPQGEIVDTPRDVFLDSQPYRTCAELLLCKTGKSHSLRHSIDPLVCGWEESPSYICECVCMLFLTGRCNINRGALKLRAPAA